MKFSKSIDSQYLSNLSQQIQILPSDEASALLLEGATFVLLAGYPNIAYQLFIKLTQGELAISEYSLLANPLKSIIPALSNSVGISCPTVFTVRQLSLKNNIDDFKVKYRSRKRFYLFGFITDFYIKRWWNKSYSIVSVLYDLSYCPNAIRRLETGILRDDIKITLEQAQEFLDSANQRKQEPEIIPFIPTVEDWRIFLEKWDKEIFENLDDNDRDNYKYEFSEVLARETCLNQGATEEEISQLEEKLQTKLPVSYKHFLLASNGFNILTEYCKLYSTDEIKWFAEENLDWAEAWDTGDDASDEEYFQYGEHQDCIHIRGRYMKTALQISWEEDGYVYLLNPQIIDNRNEWEAWDFGSKYPGAYRYRSFWEMMQGVYERCFDC